MMHICINIRSGQLKIDCKRPAGELLQCWLPAVLNILASCSHGMLIHKPSLALQAGRTDKKKADLHLYGRAACVCRWQGKAEILEHLKAV